MRYRPRYYDRSDRNEPFNYEYNTVIYKERGTLYILSPVLKYNSINGVCFLLSRGYSYCVVVAFFRVAANVPVDNKQIKSLHVKPFNIIRSFVRDRRESFFSMSIRSRVSTVVKSQQALFVAEKLYSRKTKRLYSRKKKQLSLYTIIIESVESL